MHIISGQNSLSSRIVSKWLDMHFSHTLPTSTDASSTQFVEYFQIMKGNIFSYFYSHVLFTSIIDFYLYQIFALVFYYSFLHHFSLLILRLLISFLIPSYRIYQVTAPFSTIQTTSFLSTQPSTNYTQFYQFVVKEVKSLYIGQFTGNLVKPQIKHT